MNNSIVLRKSLTAGIITALVLTTGIVDVLGAFVRTNLSGSPTNECGYGYGYDSVSGYGNGYGATCPTSGGSVRKSYGGNGNRSWDSSTSSQTKTGSSINTSSGKPSSNSNGSGSTAKPTAKPTANPYGSYGNWDDNIVVPKNNTSVNTAITIPADVSSAKIDNQNTVKRTLPATGIN